MPTDTERLDWLEAHSSGASCNYTMPEAWTVWEPDFDGLISTFLSHGQTLRSAIDAAMESEAK